ncbi:MAG: immunoglobulin domain-containing protein [Opitutaceae bacterium]
MLIPLRAFSVRLIKQASLGLLLAAGLGSPLRAQSDYATPYTFDILAGAAGSTGSVDGTGTAAQFNQPFGIALDSSGNLYVADKKNNVIRKISSSGVVTTVAGTASNAGGSANGTGTAASFNQPAGVVVDSGGNIYVADSGNNVIRKITSAGVVTTLAGVVGQSGAANSASGVSATFNTPYDVAVDGSGNVYVAEFGNNAIRKVTSSGTVTTFAGTPGVSGSTDATGTAASFNQPTSIALDSSGNLYVSDSGNNTIRKVSSAGVVTTIAGQTGKTGSMDGTGTAALFKSPRGVAVDSGGNLYVADSENGTIRKISSAGVVTTLAGETGSFATANGTGSAALFDVPEGIAVDSSGNLYVSNELGNSISKGSAAAVAAPTITQQPSSQTVPAGSGVSFSVVATGSPAPTYQWNLAGEAIPGAIDSSYSIASAAAGDAGIYTVTVTNSAGSVTSNAATLTVTALSSPPSFTTQPVSQTISNASTVVFQAVASGAPAPTLQWYFNGGPLSNATGSVLVVGGATASNAGTYYCVATNANGTAQSGSATLTVSTTPDIGRLINLSCRSQVGTGANILIAGFAVGGAGVSGSETLLIRGGGPALSSFGVTGVLPDPVLTLFNSLAQGNSGAVEIATNAGWGGTAALVSAFAQTGAFAWSSPTSHDAALLETEPIGAYTAQISGQSGDTGVALAEVYDDTPAGSYTPSTARLVNISARAQAGSGPNILIAGFVIGGSTSRTVLIRASGPALVPFGVTGVLSDPEVQLYSGSNLLASNDGWGGASDISNAAAAVNAFSWTDPTSRDSAILVTLPPGAYTAQVSGASGDSGIALIEVYEVP